MSSRHDRNIRPPQMRLSAPREVRLRSALCSAGLAVCPPERPALPSVLSRHFECDRFPSLRLLPWPMNLAPTPILRKRHQCLKQSTKPLYLFYSCETASLDPTRINLWV